MEERWESVRLPYIDKERRIQLEAGDDAETTGELNYLITSLIIEYCGDFKNIKYRTINDVVGTLECVKQEFIRRVADPYEGLKRTTNGDVGYP